MHKKKNNCFAIAELIIVLLVTVILFKTGSRQALTARGYRAAGGEVMLLLLPVIYYSAKQIIADCLTDYTNLFTEEKREKNENIDNSRGL